MKIPDSIRIGGTEYTIKIVPNLRNGILAAYGHIDYDKSLIELSATDGTEHQKRCKILWHEILHGIIEHAGINVKNEEDVVDVLSKGIYQVLQDNGARFFDISTHGGDT